MNVADQIATYISEQPEPKRSDMDALHQIMLELAPGCRTWFLDGKDEAGKIVANPNIGYGSRTIAYADGTSRDFYQVGMSANSSGISVYILGLEDRELPGPGLWKRDRQGESDGILHQVQGHQGHRHRRAQGRGR